jgi:hypothetical protein
MVRFIRRILLKSVIGDFQVLAFDWQLRVLKVRLAGSQGRWFVDVLFRQFAGGHVSQESFHVDVSAFG